MLAGRPFLRTPRESYAYRYRVRMLKLKGLVGAYEGPASLRFGRRARWPGLGALEPAPRRTVARPAGSFPLRKELVDTSVVMRKGRHNSHYYLNLNFFGTIT